MKFSIGKRHIGEDHPVFIVAELSANHGGSLETAIETIKAAKRAGADGIKLQTYTPDTITIDANNEYFNIDYGTIWDGQNLYKLYEKTYTPWEWQKELFNVAEKEGLICFSSPFDHSSVDFLESLNCPMYKIASPEIVDVNLIRYVASKGKPVIISTGIADKEDIKLAIEACLAEKNNQIALLKCTAQYPAKIQDANLIMIDTFQQDFNVIPGLSDHTVGSVVPITSTILGAKIIEKHFILNKELDSADAIFSLDESEFSDMVKAVRDAESAIGIKSYHLTDKTQSDRAFSSRSLFVVEDISKGETITDQNIRSIRPGYGLHPKHLNEVIGKRVKHDVERGQPLKWSMIEKSEMPQGD